MKHLALLLMFALQSFDSIGQQLEWINSYGSSSAFEDIINAVVTDDEGNVFITGAYHGQIQFDSYDFPAEENDNIFIAKLDSAGHILWAQTYGGSTVGDERPFDLGIDSEGNLIIVGNFIGETTFGSSTYDSEGYAAIFILKVNPSGAILWSKAYIGTGYQILHALAIGTNDEIIVTGTAQGSTFMVESYDLSSSSNATQSILIKLTSNGNVSWAKSVTATGFFSGNISQDVDVDSDGNVYMVGYFATQATFDNLVVTGGGEFTYYLAKYSSNGVVEWVKKGDGPGHRAGGFGVAISSDNRVATTGWYRGAIDFNTTTAPYASDWHIFILEYESNGDIVWSTFGVDTALFSSSTSRGYSISYDESANLYVSGRATVDNLFGNQSSHLVASSLIEGDIFVLRFDQSKNVVTNSWLKSVSSFDNCCSFPDDLDELYSSSFQKHATFENSVYLIENYQDNSQSVNTFRIAHPTDTVEVPKFGNGDFLIAKFNTCRIPEASFQSTTSQLSVTLISTSIYSDESTWDMGDGTMLSGDTVNHIYGWPGVYDVCLITSGCGGTDTICNLLSVICPLPTAEYAYTVDTLDVLFSNESTSYDSFHWVFEDGTISTAINPTREYLPGSYEVCLIAENECGSGTTCQTIEIECPFPSGAFTYSIDSLTVNFNHPVSMFDTLNWQFGDGFTSSIPDPIHTYTPGIYSVCLTNENFCGSETICQSIEITCSGTFTIETSELTELCAGDSISLFVEDSLSAYSWSDGSSTDTLTVDESGDYYLTALLDECAMYSDTVSISINAPSPMIQNDNSIQLVCMPPFETYQWFIDGAPIPGATSQTYTADSTGFYSVEVTDEIGCVGQSDEFDYTSSTSIEDWYETQSSLVVRPNPSNGKVEIILNNSSQSSTYCLYSSSGQVIGKGSSILNVTQIDLSSKPKGTYLIQIITESGSTFKRIVKI